MLQEQAISFLLFLFCALVSHFSCVHASIADPVQHGAILWHAASRRNGALNRYPRPLRFDVFFVSFSALCRPCLRAKAS
jgi:hypothetical protein